MFFRTIPFFYVLAVTKDWIMAIVIFLDWFARLIVTYIGTYKRYTYQPENIDIKVVSPAEPQVS